MACTTGHDFSNIEFLQDFDFFFKLQCSKVNNLNRTIFFSAIVKRLPDYSVIS